VQSGSLELNHMKCVALICVSGGGWTFGTTGVGASHRHSLPYFLKKVVTEPTSGTNTKITYITDCS
jgi:hypothetical protein